MCSDGDGSSKFSCTCNSQYLGERCENDRCDIYQCQNGGNCIVDLVNDIPTPRCECPETHYGATCHLLTCNIFCYHGGICDGDICHCPKENGTAKYYGENCDMSAVCDENPCQNGGKCTSIIQAINNTQVCSINMLAFTLFYRFSRIYPIKFVTNQVLKPSEILECYCADGYKGDFCEFKTEQDHLLFVQSKTPMVFNADGTLIKEIAIIDQQAGADKSCLTMLNGEAIILGGYYSDIEQQVQFK